MSELMNTQNTERGFRWHLLTTVSALALLASVNVRDAKAADDDADRPTVWIELGGQMEHAEGQGDPFTPGFLTKYSTSSVLHNITPVQAQNPPPFSFGEEGRVSFQPEGSDWVFSAAARIGRSSNSRHVDHQTSQVHHKYAYGGFYGYPYTRAKFANTHIHDKESHAVVDFSAGKDVGLGLFGKNASSILSLGVRIAQFTSKEMFDIRADPDVKFKYFTYGPKKAPLSYFHTYHATGNASRSFNGVGPSLSWNASAPFLGNQQKGEITLDWGVNVALLFGKQKAHARHHETAHYQSAFRRFKGYSTNYTVVYQHPTRGHDTDRSAMVPNVGGFAGISVQRGAAKISAGYRADFFFGAMDVGIDARKTATLGFYGPFASVSVGLGG